MTARPVSVEPVTLTMSTPGSVTSASPTSASPRTTWSRPSGAPAPANSSASRSVVPGVCGAGLMTTALPAASAGPSFQTAITSGKFHGAIEPTTPTGRRTSTEV